MEHHRNMKMPGMTLHSVSIETFSVSEAFAFIYSPMPENLQSIIFNMIITRGHCLNYKKDSSHSPCSYNFHLRSLGTLGRSCTACLRGTLGQIYFPSYSTCVSHQVRFSSQNTVFLRIFGQQRANLASFQHSLAHCNKL